MNNKTSWTNEPGETGWYWMKFRFKYRHRDTLEVVWVSQDAWRLDRMIRHSIKGWTTLEWFRRARFYGPLVPPSE
jgi:hypothetical protein